MEGNRKGSGLKLFLGTAAVAVVGSVAVWSLVGGPSDPPSRRAADVVGSGQPSTGSDQERENGAVRRVGRYVESYEVFASKDPFEPLLPRDPSGGEGPVPLAATGGVTATFQGRAQDSGLHYMVKVMKVGDRGAVIAVGDQSFSVSVGELFYERFQLMSVADQCATMLYGDDQFTLCEGESILK